jgi:UDP-2,4-diacetamido-2,4,6-trideoxy-beta-L-altropyranose hydrolase
VKVVVRADGGGAVGWGHLGRCAALAEVLRACDVNVLWACRASEAVARLVGHAPDLTLIGAPTMAALPLEEAEALATFAEDADWIIVDHYGAETAYLETLRLGSRARILLVEDHQHRQGADLRLAPMQEPAPDTLTHATYQPVRLCFSSVPRDSAREGWLVALGGADPRDDMVQCIEALGDLAPLTILASDAIAERQGLDALLATRSGQCTRIPWLDPVELAATLATSTGALVSASTLVWEAMATHTPVVALQTADNQRGVVKALRAANIPVFTDATDAGEAMRLGLAALAPPAARLDGRGAWRVARAMGVEANGPLDLDSERDS